MFSENKQEICDKLLETLQATDNARDAVNITYLSSSGVVVVEYASGVRRKINVAADSGTAMIGNIMNHLNRW